MRLLQRVVTLVKANLNELLERAEDPEKMIKQLVVDLNNQVIQVKTSVAQSMADQLLMQKRLEQAKQDAASAQQRAEFAVANNQDDLARAALVNYNSYQGSVDEMERQLEEQRKETESLKLALGQLEVKIAEVTRERDVLLARHRRAAAKEKLTRAQGELHPQRLEELLNAIGGYVDVAEARAQAGESLQAEMEARKLGRMQHEARLDDQLAALKAKNSV